MCEYIKTIEDVVGDFVMDEETFSAFDVTKQVRAAEGRGVNVEHGVVRGAVHTLMANVPGYEIVFTGKYQEYQKVAVQQSLPYAGSVSSQSPPSAPFHDAVVELDQAEKITIQFAEPVSSITISQG